MLLVIYRAVARISRDLGVNLNIPLEAVSQGVRGNVKIELENLTPSFSPAEKGPSRPGGRPRFR
jgi:hypothetical protein